MPEITDERIAEIEAIMAGSDSEILDIIACLRATQAELAEAREALKPFTTPPLYVFDRDTLWVPQEQPDDWIGGGQFSTGDFYRARAALGKEPNNGN